MKRLIAMALVLMMLVSACVPGLAAGNPQDATIRNAELSAFTDGTGYIYISGRGTPVNSTAAAEIVSIDAHRILFYAQENAALGIPATRLIALTLDEMQETVVTDDAADACLVGDDVYYIPASEPGAVYRLPLTGGEALYACQSNEGFSRLYATAEGAVAALTGGEGAMLISGNGYANYTRELAQNYAVCDGFDLFVTAEGAMFAVVGEQSVQVDANVAAWTVLQNQVYYLAKNSGVLSLKSYDPMNGLWRVVIPMCQGMKPQLTASQNLLFMLSEDDHVYTVNPEFGTMSVFTILPAKDQFALGGGAQVEEYRIEAVSGQLNVLGMVQQAQSAPTFTFVQFADQQMVQTESQWRLLTAYTIAGEDTVATLLQPAKQYSLLQLGSRGDAVSAIQEPLLKLGYYDYLVDGIYGWRTEQAVKVLQADLGLVVNGRADGELQKQILSGRLEKYDPYRGVGLGDTGLRVQNMQQRLRELGYLADSADGIFGARTQTAVSLFQKENGLRPTGTADAKTMKALYSDSASACSVYIELRKGDSGIRVRELNERLKELYYLDSKVGSDYNSATVTAVRKFQAVAGMKQTGVATAEVQKALFGRKAPENPDLITLRKGDHNDRVKEMQQRLNKLGYDAGRADGSYGSKTRDAVKMFQRIAGLKSTGTADVTTLERLFAKDAPVYVEPEKLGVPVIIMETFAAFEKDVYTVDENGNVAMISWYADGNPASYDVKVTADDGSVWLDEKGVNYEMISLPVEDIIPGAIYTVKITANPTDAKYDKPTSAKLKFMRAVPEEIPAEGVTSLVILPGGGYETAEDHLIFDADIEMVWSAAGSVLGYSWLVTDPDSDVVAGYAVEEPVPVDRFTLRAADFAAERMYTLTVTAHAADGGASMTQSLQFVFVGSETIPEETLPPVEETEAPIEATEPPAEETEAPIEATEPPVEETEAPVEETEAPVNEIGGLVIVSLGDEPQTNLGYMLDTEATFSWQVSGEAYGFAYHVEAEDGSIIPGYDSGLGWNTGVTLHEYDFVPNTTYWLMVYAYAYENDPAPLTGIVPFVFVHVDEVSPAELYGAYYIAYCGNGEGAVMADVTGDGMPEMILSAFAVDTTYGTVFTIRDGEVVPIEYVEIPQYHSDGVCGWYLAPYGDGWCLVEETAAMWQGYGEASFIQYMLTENGERIPINTLWLSDQQSGCVDEEGRLLESLIDEYGATLQNIIGNGYVISCYTSLATGPLEQLNLDPYMSVFGSGEITGVGEIAVEKPDSSTDAETEGDSFEEEIYEEEPYEEETYEEEVYEEEPYEEESYEEEPVVDEDIPFDGSGMIALSLMTYDKMGKVLDGLNFFDSMDYPGIWYANAYYNTGSGDVSVYMDFYEEPGKGVYPATLTIMDYEYIGAWVTDQLRTGMTYAEVSALEWESLGGMEAIEGGGMVTAYPEQGCMMSMLFDSASDDGRLINVTISYFE